MKWKEPLANINIIKLPLHVQHRVRQQKLVHHWLDFWAMKSSLNEPFCQLYMPFNLKISKSLNGYFKGFPSSPATILQCLSMTPLLCSKNSFISKSSRFTGVYLKIMPSFTYYMIHMIWSVWILQCRTYTTVNNIEIALRTLPLTMSLIL